MNTREKMKVMQDYLDGNDIEFRTNNEYAWQNYYIDESSIDSEPNWNWVGCQYRIKPEPKPEPTLLERIEAAYEGKEVVMLEWGSDSLKIGNWGHYHAQSMKGFYKYVYQETGDFSARSSPTLSITVKGATVFPIAVLFEK